MITLTWTGKNNSIHGFVKEMANLLVGNALSTSGASAAEDTMVIGTVTGKINDKAIKSQITKRGREMINSIQQYYKTTAINQTRKRKELYNEQYTFMQNKLLEEMKAISNDIEKSELPEDIFIYHESLKLYSRIETGTHNEYEGRELNILSIFDRLYSLAGIEHLILPQKEILISIAANLSDLAVGKQLRDPLARYLSIFSGLLMFEDIRNIALAAQNAIEIPNVHAIHLYLLNDTYVPGSMILTNIYDTIKKFGQISAENAAKVEIHTTDANAIIQNYLNRRNAGAPYDGDDWDIIADEVIKNTKVQIIFLAGFIQLLQELSKL